MREKYYNLVVELIQKNKKYSGCESVLDSIVDEVFEKSSAVLDNINDIEVIENYLNKIITASIITVAKKLNVHNRPTGQGAVLVENSISRIHKNEELTQLLKNETEEKLIQEVLEEGTEVVVEVEVEDAEEIEALSDIEEIEYTEHTEYIEETVEIEEITEESVETDFIEETTKNELSELSEETFDEEFDLDGYTGEQEFVTEEPAEEETEENEELFAPQEEDPKEEVEDTISQEESNDEEELLDVAESFDVNLVDKMINGVREDDLVIELDESEELVPMADDISGDVDIIDISDNEELISDIEVNMNLEPEFVSEPDSESVVNDTLIEESNVEDSSLQSDITAPLNYEIFDYTPQVEEFDKIYTEDCLMDLARKNPNSQILEICELKYNQNKSVEEIASLLNLEVASVLEALNEIVDVIKD